MRSYAGQNTTNMEEHLKKHGIQAGAATGTGMPPYGETLQHEIAMLLTAGFNVLDLRPDTLFESPHAKQALQALLPRVRLPSHQTVARFFYTAQNTKLEIKRGQVQSRTAQRA